MSEMSEREWKENAALQAEIATLRAASEWQDIASAPKDGTEVVLGRPGLVLGQFSYRNPRYSMCGAQWYSTLWNLDYWVSEPTHWRPLPDPPGSPTDKKGIPNAE